MPNRPWIWRQRWVNLLFAHWPVPASAARRLIPASLNLEVEEFAGTAWVGLVPFQMEDVMFRGLPEVPRFSRFPEMNLRLSVTHKGRPGVWFVSLDATNPLAVWGARRFAHLPYFEAAMQVQIDGHRVRYDSVRRAADRPVIFRGSYWPTSNVFEAAPGSLEHFLTERYRLYTAGPDQRLLTIDIHHQPWALQYAAADIVENTVAEAQGLPLIGRPLLHYSRRQGTIGWTIALV
jgi:uncharacterized protein YqjF (DUF2071 family)